MFKRYLNRVAVWTACLWILSTVAVLAQAYLAVNGANHDYLTLTYYINEPTDSETIYIEFWPNAANVEQAQIWGNLNRRDYATLDDQDSVSVPGPAPASANYFVGFPLTHVGGGKWTAELPVNKTGAYRLTARYKVSGNSNWQWVGGRDTAVMVSPKKARDVILYELQVNVINATGDDFNSRSTFEDLMNPSKPANLDYFEQLGVNTLWIQPIHPIGSHYCITVDGPGSPYSIQNMWEVAPHHSQGNTRESSMAAFTNFAAAAKAKNIDFFFDIIFNHTSWDAEIGRDPDDPTQPASNPTAKIKDILPQWYSRYDSTWLPCGEDQYNQNDFQYWLPAQNANQIGPAPAERNDFGKWADVADLFWGTYPALFNPHTDTDAYWDVSQAGADVKRMVEYFAYFGQYWIEKSGGTLGGFRCDYAQGIPPQAWEYIVNKTRQHKWDFIFMAESLDGGNVSKRAGRHMDIINQNWVWQVLGGGGNTTGLRGVIDDNKSTYGYAGIMRGLINHDQNAPDDVWYSFSRYAVGAVVDGAPQMYQGQELGYRNGYGFSQFREQYDRLIPHIFKWHNMQTLWNNRIGILENAYQRVNRGRQLSPVTRLHDQWYLNQMNDAPHQEIFSVLKYEKFGWDPAHQDVVLNFVNLTPWTQRQGTFKLSGVNAIYLNPTRYYNVRNLTSDNPDQQLWAEPGLTGQQLLDNGIYVNMPGDGNASPDTAFVQMLVLEEHGGNQPPDPWVTWDPENPVGCTTVTIRYRKADSPLGAAPVYIHIGRNGWQDAIEPNPQMTSDGDYWVYEHAVEAGTEVLDFAFNDGNPDEEARVWDNNGGQDWHVIVNGCTGPVVPVAWTLPQFPEGCDDVTIYYDSKGRNLSSANPVYIHVGYNGWNGVIEPNPAMTDEGDGVWSYTYSLTPGTEVINFVFNNGSGTWDNNNTLNWSVQVTGCEGLPPPPSGLAITNPPSSIVVANEVNLYTLQGIAQNMEGTLNWSNSLTGAFGSFAHADPWTLADVALGVGANAITVSGLTIPVEGIVTNAEDTASNYGGSWSNGDNFGTGFGAWAITPSGTAGTFIGADGWGLWSEDGSGVEAVRPFSQALDVGGTFHIRMKNGWIYEFGNGGSIGIELLNSSGVSQWYLYFEGGDAFYTTPDGFTDIAYTDAGLDVEFTITGATSFSVDVTPVGGGSTRTYTGTFSGQINQVRAWSWHNGTNDGNNNMRDFFINNLKIVTEGSGEAEPRSHTVTITRLEAEEEPDSNGDGIPDAWYNQYGLNPNTPNLADVDSDSDGMTNREEYIAGTHPVNGNSFLHVEQTGYSPSQFSLRWPSVAGRVYSVHRSSDLTQPNGGFTSIVSDLAATPPINTYDDNSAVDPGTYIYRIEVQMAE